MKEAGAQFIHASAVFGKTVEKLGAVPRPAADDARLLKWFKQLEHRAGQAAHAGQSP